MRLDAGQIEVVDEVMAEVLRQKEPWERIAIGFNLWTGAWNMLAAHLSSLHPDWTEEQVRREVARRMSHGEWDLLDKKSLGKNPRHHRHPENQRR